VGDRHIVVGLGNRVIGTDGQGSELGGAIASSHVQGLLQQRQGWQQDKGPRGLQPLGDEQCRECLAGATRHNELSDVRRLESLHDIPYRFSLVRARASRLSGLTWIEVSQGTGPVDIGSAEIVEPKERDPLLLVLNRSLADAVKTFRIADVMRTLHWKFRVTVHVRLVFDWSSAPEPLCHRNTVGDLRFGATGKGSHATDRTVDR
jgi:hypothetical protein